MGAFASGLHNVTNDLRGYPGKLLEVQGRYGLQTTISTDDVTPSELRRGEGWPSEEAKGAGMR